MRILVISLMIILLLSSTGFAFQRDMSLSFVGDIDYTSQHGSNIAESVVEIKGTGSGKVEQTASAGDNLFNHEADIAITTADSVGSKLSATVGIKTPLGIYVSKASPGRGETAELYQLAEVSNSEFAFLAYGGEITLSHGIYQRHIELINGDLFIREILSIVGSGAGKDMIRFGYTE